ncbi:MAG: DUF58 domain-containing protein [Cytophagales bacterium]|nr:DUF58 domain-containing protein [Cytophagales bacterium]
MNSNKIDLQKFKPEGNLELLAKQMVEGFITGLHKSPYHGFSVEFAEHRSYNTGESTRHIDWKIYARTDKLFIKKYEEETNLRCMILLDTSSSMHYPQKGVSKFQTAATLCAALAFLLQKQRDAFGLTCFSDQIENQTPIKSTAGHLHKVLLQLNGLLENKTIERKTAMAETLHEISTKLHRRSLVIIFSDMMENEQQIDQLMTSLQHLKHNKHEILLFHVTDKKTEQSFEFTERPHEFIDIESGEKIKLNPSQIKKHYQQAMSSYLQQLRIRCGQAKIDLVEVDINDDYQHVLSSYLLKRAKMK